MIEFTYAINSESVDRALQAFQESLADQAPALKRVADDFREAIARQFASEGRAEGTPWPPLAPSTLKRGRSTSAMLFRSGALLRSLTQPGATGHVEQLDEQSLLVGTRVPYALFHQYGTRRMPARPIIVLSGTRTERWVEIVRQQTEESALLLRAKELGGKEL